MILQLLIELLNLFKDYLKLVIPIKNFKDLTQISEFKNKCPIFCAERFDLDNVELINDMIKDVIFLKDNKGQIPDQLSVLD